MIDKVFGTLWNEWERKLFSILITKNKKARKVKLEFKIKTK